MLDSNAEYVRLKEAGHSGWGGEQFSRRRDAWSKVVARLLQDDAFPKPPSRLLELGCGNGMVSALFAGRGYMVDGVDLSEAAILWARENFEGLGVAGSFRKSDVCAMPFYHDGSFDAVIDGNCLHCVIGPDRSRCLAEVRRILRPGGPFFVSSMCGEPKSDNARARFDAQNRRLVENGQPYRTLKPADELLKEVLDAGFQVSGCEISENPWWDHLTAIAVKR